MDNKDTNRMNMINTTVQHCSDNSSATSGIPAFATAFNDTQTKITLINSLEQIATGTTKGVTTDTNAIRKAMSDLAFKCAVATFAYATAANNNTLKAQVNYTRTAFDKMKKEEVDDVCQNIHDVANSNIGNVQNYGASTTDVSNLQTAINLYRNSSQNPRQSKISILDSKKQIKELIRQIIDTEFKGLMDKMVLTLKAANPNFVNQYFQAREIIDIGTTHTKLRGTVTSNGIDPIPTADVILYDAETTNIAFQTKSGTDGKFSINFIIPNLDYDLKISKTGFADFTEPTIHFSPGEEVNRDVILSPI